MMQLVREDLVEALKAGNTGHRRDVGGRCDRRECTLAHDDGVDELHRDLLGISAGNPVTEYHPSALAVEADSHRVTCCSKRLGIICHVIQGWYPPLEEIFGGGGPGWRPGHARTSRP